MSKILLIFIFLFMVCCTIGCSDNSAGGSAGEIGNPKVVVIVLNENGVPVESVSVVALLEDYNPLTDSKMSSQYSDSNGYVLISLPDTGVYVISGKSQERSRAFISAPLSFIENEIDTIFDTLKGFGAISIFLNDSINYEGKIFYLAGTNYSVPLSEAMLTSNGLTLILDSLPEGMTPPIILYDTLTNTDNVIKLNPIAVIDGEKSNVDILLNSNFFTSDYLEENALGVQGVIVDTSGSRWIACSSAIIYETSPSKWATYKVLSSAYNGDYINSVLVDRDDAVWFAGNGGIIRHYHDSAGGYWQFWDSSKEFFSNDTVITMAINSLGSNIWIATSGGITTFRDGDTSLIDISNLSFDVKSVTSITEAKRNEAWIGTSEGELLNLHQDNSFSPYLLNGSGLDTCKIIDMVEDNDTTLWIITDKNVLSFNNGTWRIVDPTTYCHIKVKRVTVNKKDGALWFLSNVALSRYDGASSTLIHSEEFEVPLISVSFPERSTDGIGYVGMRKGVVEIK